MTPINCQTINIAEITTWTWILRDKLTSSYFKIPKLLMSLSWLEYGQNERLDRSISKMYHGNNFRRLCERIQFFAFYFKIIVCSYAVVGNATERFFGPFSHFSPSVTFYKTLGQITAINISINVKVLPPLRSLVLSVYSYACLPSIFTCHGLKP